MTSEKPEVSAVENATERSQLARKRKSANDIICGTVFLDVLLAAFANSRGLYEGLKSGLIRHAPGGRGWRVNNVYDAYPAVGGLTQCGIP